MTRTIRSDAFDSGNSMTNFVETWELCDKHGEYETDGFSDTGCPECETERETAEFINDQKKEELQ